MRLGTGYGLADVFFGQVVGGHDLPDDGVGHDFIEKRLVGLLHFGEVGQSINAPEDVGQRKQGAGRVHRLSHDNLHVAFAVIDVVF